jgi:hypothetical protein
MLILWDNRCVLHRATGGYEGHARLLHRTTIGAACPPLQTAPPATSGRKAAHLSALGDSNSAGKL